LEPVVDTGFGGNSIFSYFLIRTLKENQKPFLIPSDLFSYIKAGVVENAEQFPRFGSLKDAGGQQGGELVLFLKEKLTTLSSKISEREKELKRLRQIEANVKGAREEKAQEIKKREKELTIVDNKIKEMKEKLGANTVDENGSLDTLFAITQQKKEQQQYIKKLQDEQIKQQSEIEHLKFKDKLELIETLKKDIYKYQEVVSSIISNEMKILAWNSLLAKYPEGKGLSLGEAEKLLFMMCYPNKNYNDFFTTNSIGIKFVFIPPGTFMMGENHNSQRVTITEGFYMGITEVTQKQWKIIMWNNPSHFPKKANRTIFHIFSRGNDNLPVECVSWEDCQKFIRKLNQTEGTNKYRLPSEAEWEYACRAGTNTPFYYGNCLSPHQANYNANYPLYGCPKGKCLKKTLPVASLPPNRWGLYDMHGNVWEWCQAPKGHPAFEGRKSMSGIYSRGGSWGSSAKACSCDYHNVNLSDFRGNKLGFRLVKDP